MIRTITGLKTYLKSQIAYQEKALAEDHPKSQCAKSHRYMIKAYKQVLANITTKGK